MVFQWPCGTGERSRSPRGERPRVRAMLVEIQVSSRDTRRGWIEIGQTLKPRLAPRPLVRSLLLGGAQMIAARPLRLAAFFGFGALFRFGRRPAVSQTAAAARLPASTGARSAQSGEECPGVGRPVRARSMTDVLKGAFDQILPASLVGNAIRPVRFGRLGWTGIKGLK